MRNTSTVRQGFKALLLAGSVSVIALATPAFAQDEGDEEDEGSIVITGSRIQRPDFEANSPIVTVDETFLKQSSSAALEDTLNKLPMFVPAKTPTQGGDIQPTATNTPGSATISLRGIGANRTLVLVDGRRSTPSNASGVTDITTIPSSAISRVETISGGASATYGADAVAGVTNFILKKDFNGLELDGQMSVSDEGDGFEYQIGGIMGSDFADGRGNVSIAMSFNTREGSYQRDRSWYRDIWADPSIGGTQFFIDTPGINFGFGNLPNFETVFGAAAPNGNIFEAGSFGVTVFSSPSGNAFTTGATQAWGHGGWDGDEGGFPHLRQDTGALTQNNTNLYLFLPLTRYNFLARGNYEINDWIGVFAQGMFSHVETYTRNEPGPIFAGWGATIDPTKLDADQLPDDMWTLLNSRGNPNAPFTLQALMPDDRETLTDVTTYNMLFGFEGYIPGTDWTWDLSVNHGVSSTFARQTGVYSLERVRTVLNSGNFGKGFSRTGNASSGGFGASTATCTSGLNFFKPPAGGFSEDCLEAIRADLKNTSNMRQTIVEANLQGKLVDLPAGEVRAALGASYREQDYEFINDTLTTAGRSFQDQALGIYPSGNSFGYIDVKEVYGELLIPILADTPGFHELNLELGGRISDYSTTGTSYTYKALADWRVTDWFRIRGGYNRAERAPNIGELFLSAQQTFGFNTTGDLCSSSNPLSFSANPANANGNAVRAVCEVLMDQTGDLTAKDFFYLENPPGTFVNGAASTATFGFAFPTLVGNPDLKPEVADTWTAGLVINSPFSGALSNLRLSLDWWRIEVNDAIGPQTVGLALRNCLDANLNPLVLTDANAAANTNFCQNVPRNAQNGGLGNVKTTYANNGRFIVSGIDAQIDWSTELGGGQLGLNVILNYLIDFKSAEIPTDPLIDYVGTFGSGQNSLNPGPYEFRGITTLSYSISGLYVGLQWQHWSSIEDTSEAQFGPNDITGGPAYDLFNLNGSYAVTDNLSVRFGVNNLFDRAPPLINRNTANEGSVTQLPGGGFNSLFYDTFGRSFYLGANVKF